jgi:penicillin G amidase
MIRRLAGAAATLVVFGGLTWVGARGAGTVPPLGQLLDPVNGVWGAAAHASLPRRAAGKIPGLQGPVDVRYDDRGVPHIFASTEPDAYRALGYVVARDRLFQLDLQTHAASGRLTEWAGRAALPLDRETRDLGMPRAAEVKLASIDTTTMVWKVMTAFSDGANAYIDGMQPSQWPVEYRLLGVRPERWKPINSIHLFNRMGWTLTYFPYEADRLAAAGKVGDAAADALFPVNSPVQEPLQPTGARGPQFEFSPIPAPGRPDTVAVGEAALLRAIDPLGSTAGVDPSQFASNNWAVAPARSADGHALLANDPHLDLTLPSIWYETQLVVPGQLDVYGVTIPGAPGIVLGFNRDVAWGFTNTSADVLDFYRETVDDTVRPTKYEVDGVWKPLEQRVEVYRGKHGETLATDTVRYTSRGPLMHRSGTWVSMRWTVLEPSNEIGAFYAAAHATSARELLDSMASGFFVPAQNVLVADRQGAIAIRSTGHFPIRPKGHTGMDIFDGSTSASDWTGYWPVDKYPQSFNPAQGFLASANQQPEDREQAFAYLGDDVGFDPWRALDINQLLRADSSVTVDDMRRFQVSPLSVRVQLFLPYFLKAAAGAVPQPSVVAATMVLKKWDGRYTRDNGGAVLFEEAMRQLRNFTWDELDGSKGHRVATPSDAVMLELLQQPSNIWWDQKITPQVTETRDMILVRALNAAYDTLVKRLGPPESARWRWDSTAKVTINHLLRIKPFSVIGLITDGGRGTLNPARRRDRSELANGRGPRTRGASLGHLSGRPERESGEPAVRRSHSTVAGRPIESGSRPPVRRGAAGRPHDGNAHPRGGARAMMRGLARLALVAAAFALGTYAFGWWSVAVVGVLWGVINPRMPRVAVRAGVGAAVAWAFLLAIPAASGAPMASFTAKLAAVMRVPSWGLIAAELLFPAALAWSAASLGALSRLRPLARDAAPRAR